MIQRIADHGIVLVKQHLEQAAVGIEAAGIQDGIAHFQEARKGLLQLLVAGLRSANEAHGCQTESRCFQALPGRFNETPVVGQPQIIIGAEIQYIIAVRQMHLGRLRAVQDTLGFVEPVGAQLLDLALNMI